MGVPASNFQNRVEASGEIRGARLDEFAAPGDPAQPCAPAEACRQLDALFCATRQRVLGLLYGQPDASFLASELIRPMTCGP